MLLQRWGQWAVSPTQQRQHGLTYLSEVKVSPYVVSGGENEQLELKNSCPILSFLLFSPCEYIM